jgi:hypothetical protein
MTSVKRHLFLLSLLTLVACSGGGSDPVKPAPVQQAFVLPSGHFQLTATKTIDGCLRTDVWDGDYDIVIDGTTFTMGQFTGTWTPSSRLAKGEGTRSSHLVRSCTVTDYATCYLTFTNKDSFYGSILHRHSIKGSCSGLTGCSTTWTIVGTRTSTD